MTELMWIDGELVPSERATVHVLSHGMQRGSTVFDVMKVVHLDPGPAVFGLREHTARFMQSMELMGMTPSVSLADLEAAIAETVRANPEAVVVKLAAAWAEVPMGNLPTTTTPSLFVAALPPDNSDGAVADPTVVRLRTATAPKTPSTILPPTLKVAASYTVGVRERLAAVAAGFDDVVFRTVDGDLAEGTTKSLFVVQAGKVLLPPIDSVLDGITRRAVVDLVRHQGIDLDVRPVYWDEVTGADELFLCSTHSQVLPVAGLDDRELVAPGPVSAALSQSMAELLAGTHQLSARWLTPVG